MQNTFCTPENSPISDHSLLTDISRPLDYTKMSNSIPEGVLDLCTKRSKSTEALVLDTPPKQSPISYHNYQQNPIIPTYPPMNIVMHQPTNYHDRGGDSSEENSVQSADTTHSGYHFGMSNSSPNYVISSTISPAAMKTTRPFKAYPKDPMVLATRGRTYEETRIHHESYMSYEEYRRNVLDRMQTTNSVGLTNPKMRRNSRSSSGQQEVDSKKDAAYLERRRKNNEAAKRSRDARRAKEDEIAIRAAYLEQENIRLKIELAALREEMAKFRAM